MSDLDKQFGDIKDHLNGQFKKEEEKINLEIDALRTEEMKKVKGQTPALPLLDQLTPNAKENVIKSGLDEYKSKIEGAKNTFLGGL